MATQLPFLIGLSGKKGVGKDFIAQTVIAPHFVRQGCRVTTMAFADALKVFLVAGGKAQSIDALFSDQKSVETRQLLQTVGTDMIRKSHGQDWWIRQLEAWIRVRQIRDPVNVVIIPDVRFQNELEWIERNGGLVIRVQQPGEQRVERTEPPTGYFTSILRRFWWAPTATTTTTNNHVSEQQLDDYPFEYYVTNNGSASAAELSIQMNGFLSKAQRNVYHN